MPGNSEERFLQWHGDTGLLQDHSRHGDSAGGHEGHEGSRDRLHGAGQLPASPLPQRPLLQHRHQMDGDPQFDGAVVGKLCPVCTRLLGKQGLY
ncbi:hypothetical protein CEXT_641171 [Caerostris extrusa]|uniref:Uncharacterized protein n=1 Tax=Caerostris extrusa TaxID=172846 RepID=A0AAV4N676_CAEEX|nr:hypothetical protein CEXT_641171 [Caerostris extrusa]